MISLTEPSETDVRRILDEQRERPFSYSEIGASRNGAPPGYPVNHHRSPLGRGEKDYQRAIDAIRSWRMYDLNWTRLYSPDTPIEPGRTVAIVARHFGFWSLNVCRIIYVLDDSASLKRYGFAFGTLPEHVEQGEERFAVELVEDGSVWFELFAFARARHPLARMAPPLAALLQRRFAREAAAAIQRFVGAGLD